MDFTLRLPAPLARYEGREALLAALAHLGAQVTYAATRIPWIAVQGATLTGEALTLVPGVLAVEDDGRCENCPVTDAAVVPGTDLTWPAQYVGAIPFHPTTRGAGITIAVLDTGLAPHPDLTGATITAVESFVPSEDALDLLGHGTAVLGLLAGQGPGIVGVAPEASYVALKVLDRTGQGQWSWLTAAVERCMDLGVHVVNLSLGGTAERSGMFEAAMVAYAEAGGIAVAAAGNAGLGMLDFPAQLPVVLAAGALDQAGYVPPWSHWGALPENPDGVAPGVGVPCLGRAADYRSYDGTSFSTPLMAGVVALLLAHEPTLVQPGVRAPDPKFLLSLPATLVAVRRRLAAYGVAVNAVTEQAGYGLPHAVALGTSTLVTPPYALTTQRGLPTSRSVPSAVVGGAVALGVAGFAILFLSGAR